MRRVLFAIAIATALAATGWVAPIQAQDDPDCGACVPVRDTSIYVDGPRWVCIEGTDPGVDRPHSFNEDEYLAAKDAVEAYWNDALSAQDHYSIGVYFNFRDYNDCETGDIRIQRDTNITDDRPFTETTSTGEGAIVHWPGSNYIMNWFEDTDLDDGWRAPMAHEFAHVLGFKDAYTGGGSLPGYCQSKTSLGSSGAWNWQTNTRCSDSLALFQLYGPTGGAGDPPPEDEPITYGGNECYNRYEGTANGICWNVEFGFYYCDVTWYFVYMWCP